MVLACQRSEAISVDKCPLYYSPSFLIFWSAFGGKMSPSVLKHLNTEMQ